MIPANPKLTKLRIISDRTTRESLLIEKRAEEEKRAAAKKRQKARYAYEKACAEAGYCAGCEEKFNKCNCIPVAGPQENSFSYGYV